MTKNIVKSLALILLLAIIFLSSNALAEPNASNISITPEKPTPLSTITITVNIQGEDISSVEISISECDDITCFKGGTETMNEIQEGTYQAEYTLQDTENKADHIEINSIEVVDNGTPYTLENDSWKFDISVTLSNGENGNTPGFEILTFIVSMAIIIVFLTRKRLK